MGDEACWCAASSCRGSRTSNATQRGAAVLLHSVVRRGVARKQFRAQKAGSVKVQALIRARLSARKYKNELGAITLGTSIMRCALQRVRYMKQKVAALLLHRVSRGMLVRLRIRWRWWAHQHWEEERGGGTRQQIKAEYQFTLRTQAERPRALSA